MKSFAHTGLGPQASLDLWTLLHLLPNMKRPPSMLKVASFFGKKRGQGLLVPVPFYKLLSLQTVGELQLWDS